MTEYAIGLGDALDKNIGLDHSKVREYWLSRGPRLCMTAIAYFVFTLACQELLRGGVTPLQSQDRLYVLATNSVALLVALYLLYKRLGDAIEGVVARASHDYYFALKKTSTPFQKLAEKVGSRPQPREDGTTEMDKVRDVRAGDELVLSLEGSGRGCEHTGALTLSPASAVGCGSLSEWKAVNSGDKSWGESRREAAAPELVIQITSE